MGRGIFFGFIWGGLVSVLGLSVASIVGEGPTERATATEPATQQEVPPKSAEPPATAPAPEPMGVDQPEAPVADTSPAALPETGGTVAEPDTPEVVDDVVGDVTGEEPVLPSPQAMAPQVSDGEEAPEVVTETPAETPIETPTEQETSSEEPTEGETSEDAAPVVISEAPQAPVAPQQDSVETTQPDLEAGSEAASEQPAEDASDMAEDPTAQEGAPAPRIALQGEQGSSVGQPVGTLSDRAENVETGRLPTITADTPDASATDDAATADAAETPTADPDAPPLERFAAAWDNPESRPLMSILLIDDGSSPIGADALRSFPYPITFAVPATAPDAAQMMAKYRAEGFEVLALADLPEGAAPSDIEVALDASLSAVPEAAGVLIAQDVPGGRQGTEQIIDRLGRSGHGLVTASTGLNSTAQLADSTGFPAANIFDDMDSEGQTPTVIRRFLDNAAFRAAQGEEVIMMGRIRPDTISALLLWGLSDRAGRVALVPVSAVLTAD
ncbi:divergent polysaccharide deacetylase family protein [Cognatishimia sp. MH4019]|uniref:divergent polysaccharide deacetylase family protein n=1 Tax=Cognatishimia sp. MH4019 TaxID=2854030 RepID=UPI001CD7169B|nr:divergent polysaccharide deacetylase family protein [Cognatishimia sp. MH4019]